MKGILLLNGTPYQRVIDKGDAIVCCTDGAYSWAKNVIDIDYNIGDFDSLNELPHPSPYKVYPKEKNLTDGEIGVRLLIEKGCDQIDIYGGFGGRSDHFLGNLHLLYYAFSKKVTCTMLSTDEIIFLSRGEITFDNLDGKTISVIPFKHNIHIGENYGFKYAYPKKISFGQSRGISNIVLSNAKLVITKGIAIVVINRVQV